MKTLLLATHNKAKLQELKMGVKELENLGIKIVSLKDLHISKTLEESGKTFCKNALLKAKFYAKIAKLPTIADDGGLLIPSLNNEPGVKSRRWLGYDASDEELIAYTLKRVNGYIKQHRVAYLKTCLCFYDGASKIYFHEQEKIKGYIAQKPSGKATDGYPFRALFIVEKFNKYYDELTDKEHEKINHRLKALKRLVTKIKKLLIQ